MRIELCTLLIIFILIYNSKRTCLLTQVGCYSEVETYELVACEYREIVIYAIIQR